MLLTHRPGISLPRRSVGDALSVTIPDLDHLADLCLTAARLRFMLEKLRARAPGWMLAEEDVEYLIEAVETRLHALEARSQAPGAAR